MGILTDDPETEASRQWTERVIRFRSDIEASLQALAAPLETSPASGPLVDSCALDAVRDILDAGRTGAQRDILRALLRGSELCFRRAILLIGRDHSLVGWERRGFGEQEWERGEGRAAVRLAATGDHLVARARAIGAMVVAGPEGPGDEILQGLGGGVPLGAAAAPLRVRDRAVAVLYGDSPEAVSAGRLGLFDLLARVGSLELELRASRRRLAAAAEAGMLVPAPTREGRDRDGLDANPAAPEEAEMQALLSDLEALPRREEGDGLSPEEQRQHNDARRFASLLVSELLLYNEEAVIQGRKQRDLSRRLAPEIERTRRAYEARVPSALRTGPRYLEDELLRVLADGDEALLTV